MVCEATGLVMVQTYSCMRTMTSALNIILAQGFRGSSAINGMMWIRGSRHDFDNWERHGSTGWSYADVLPYFIKVENVQDSGKITGSLPLLTIISEVFCI